jgi:hypothetical protein
MERCGKINASNSGSESWTGIDVVAGFWAVVLIRQGPHIGNMDANERITLLQRLQEVGTIYKTRNQLCVNNARFDDLIEGSVVGLSRAPNRLQTTIA